MRLPLPRAGVRRRAVRDAPGIPGRAGGAGVAAAGRRRGGARCASIAAAWPLGGRESCRRPAPPPPRSRCSRCCAGGTASAARRRTRRRSSPRARPARCSRSRASTTWAGRSSGTTASSARCSFTTRTCGSTSRSRSTSTSWATRASTSPARWPSPRTSAADPIDAIGATKIRDLHDFRLRTVAEVRDDMLKVKQRFTPERWAEFKSDLAFFRAAMGPSFINTLDDHGANAPPSWVWLARLAIGHVPATETTLTIAGLIDAVLLLAMAWAIWACFGLLPMLAAMTVFGATDLYMFGTNWAGATLRHDWLVLIGFAACALRKERWLLAGALLGAGTMLRVVPAVGLFGVVAPAIGLAGLEGHPARTDQRRRAAQRASGGRARRRRRRADDGGDVPDLGRAVLVRLVDQLAGANQGVERGPRDQRGRPAHADRGCRSDRGRADAGAAAALRRRADRRGRHGPRSRRASDRWTRRCCWGSRSPSC